MTGETPEERARISEYVQRLVDEAPPLTEDQKVRLMVLLHPVAPK